MLQAGDRGNKSATLVTQVKVIYFTHLNYALRHEEVWEGGDKGPLTLHLTLDKNWMIIFGPQPFCPRIKWPRYPTWTRRGEHRISETTKSLKTDSFETQHSRCGWEASVVSQSLFISLCVNIHTLRCTYSNMLITECCSTPNGDVTKYAEHMNRYYLSKIQKILHSETHLALRVSDNGLRTCIRSVQNRPCFRDAGSNLKKKTFLFIIKNLATRLL
jgi:hypothetical protein